MPLPLAIPVGLLLGMSLAWLARTELARSEQHLVLARPFLVAVSLGVVVYGPVLGYFAALHGDWAYLYLVRWSRVPSALDLALVAAAAASVPAGFAAASERAAARRGSSLLRIATPIALLVLAAVVALAPRLSVSASYAQYHGGFGAVPIGKSSLGRGVLVGWAAIAAAYAWAARVLRASAHG